MDSEFRGGKPAEGPHGEVVGAAVMDGKLFCKVVEGIEAAAGVKAFLVFPVAALDLPIVAGGMGLDELVPDPQFPGSFLEQGGQITLAVGKAVGERKPVVRLDTFHPDAPAGIPLGQLFEEVGGGVRTRFRVGGQEAQASEFIHGGVLVQTQLRIGDTPAGHHLHIHLDPLAGAVHLLVRLGPVRLFLLSCRKQPQFPHDPEQALRAAGITPLP